jgi:hypothetical protein
MNDISQEIVQCRKLINQIEMLNANPALQGKKQLNDTVIDLATLVQVMLTKVVDYA